MNTVDKWKDTIKNISMDDDHPMINSQMEVYSFDKVKEWYVTNKIPKVNPHPKSNDALYIGENESFFIEFKNGKIDNAVNFEINKKIYDSLFILFDMEDWYDSKHNRINSISYTRENMNYILVYNQENYAKTEETRLTTEGINRQKKRLTNSKNRDDLFANLRKLGREEMIKFGLDQFKDYFFKNIYTYTEKEFEEKFIQLYSKI